MNLLLWVASIGISLDQNQKSKFEASLQARSPTRGASPA